MSELSQEKAGFWTGVARMLDFSAYRPQRREEVEVARLEVRQAPYYVLKQTQTRDYVRLTEEDYALWWQMNGRKSVKELLFYNFKRYGSLPVGRMSSLIGDLRDGHFLSDGPTHLYRQIEEQLEARAPANNGRRLLNAFLHSEFSVAGLDPYFSAVHRVLQPIFAWPAQLALLWIILVGGAFFAALFRQQQFSLTQSHMGFGWSLLTLILANFLVIAVHELAHGVTTKQIGREIDRGGFLIYWGLPAFFVDTRDTWLSPRLARMAVSWAGPHSGLLLGGITGFILMAVTIWLPGESHSPGATFIFQVGFIAYFTVFINLNPLLELDGYFILTDWLDMPGLRRRAFAFLRSRLGSRVRATPQPRPLWLSLNRSERIFTLFGVVALAYSVYALLLALYFWQTRAWPLFTGLWAYGWTGRLVVLLVVAALVVPSLYYLLLFTWSQVQVALNWLARHDLLHRPAVLAGLAAAPLLLLLLLIYGITPPLFQAVVALVYLAAMVALGAVATQLPGSRFQWALWCLVVALAGLTVAWSTGVAAWRQIALIVAAGAALGAGLVSWFTVTPVRPERWTTVALLAGAGGLIAFTSAAGIQALTGRAPGLVTVVTAVALALIAAVLLNFWQSRFILPWGLLALAVAGVAGVEAYPDLAPLLALLWLYAALVYLLLATQARFSRAPAAVEVVPGERERLANAFSHFVKAMIAAYEPVFGRRRLPAILAEVQKAGYVDGKMSLLEVGERCRRALLLLIDRLDDLAGTPFTARIGQAAYDSLPWPEAETLARHVLSRTAWGARLAREFIRVHDHRAELIRQADIFAGFDRAGVKEVLSIARPWRARKGATLARAGSDARRFFLIESGEVAVVQEGVEVGRLIAGAYFGVNALLDSGAYEATYRAIGDVHALVVERAHFDPLLRADTTLSSQVSAGAEERALLKRMPLFSSLSPQQLAALDARLQPLAAAAGSVIVCQGQARSHLFIVTAGRVEALHERPDGDQVVDRFGPGEHFGDYALLADVPYLATYRAVVDSHLLLLDEPTFDRLLADCAELSHYVEQIGSGRLLQTRRRLDATGILG
jgi:putative peptide zinc metalloprotease protein